MRLAWLLAALALAGCVPQGSNPAGGGKSSLALTPVAFAALPGWEQDDLAKSFDLFADGCGRIAASASTVAGQKVDWHGACALATTIKARGNAETTDDIARHFFEMEFIPYRIADTTASPPTGGAALLTGYFDPEVRGSRSPSGTYATPLLGRPGDLVQVDLGDFVPDLAGRSVTGRVENGRLVPYFARAQIEAGALAKHRLELLWLADPIDALVLQIQGSGRVDLPDGHVVRVTYAGQNGLAYVPIGRVLVERGAMTLDQVSMPAIRAWLQAHPDQARGVIDQNPSYVFFRELDGVRPDQGPPGALGVALTPGRSLAVDRAFIPLGAPIFVATTDPVSGENWQRLMVAQDLGGAIRGPARADIFFGWGKPAEERAGRMRAHGEEYV